MFAVKKLSVLLLTVLFVLGAGFSALGQGVLKVATEAGFMPFEYVDAESGELMGFDMDLIRAIGECWAWSADRQHQLGRPDSGPAQAPRLPHRRDHHHPERQGVVDFSEPYFESVLTVVATPEQRSPAWRGWRARPPLCRLTPPEISRPRSSGCRGTQGVARFDTVADAMQAVLIGVADIVLIDLPVAEAYLAANPRPPWNMRDRWPTMNSTDRGQQEQQSSPGADQRRLS